MCDMLPVQDGRPTGLDKPRLIRRYNLTRTAKRRIFSDTDNSIFSDDQESDKIVVSATIATHQQPDGRYTLTSGVRLEGPNIRVKQSPERTTEITQRQASCPSFEIAVQLMCFAAVDAIESLEGTEDIFSSH